MKTYYRTVRRQHGVALLEALIAAVILAIGLLGAVGLQARSYAAISDAGLRAEATLAGEELIGIMNNDQANAVAYAGASPDSPSPRLAPWVASLGARIPGAQYSVAVVQTTFIPRGPTLTPRNVFRVDITISWVRRQGDKPNRHQLTSYIM